MLNYTKNMGENVVLADLGEDFAVYKMQSDNGSGVMTMYRVFDGIYVLYNDFRMPDCVSYFQPSAEMLCIDHCRSGRIEWQTNDGRFLYIESGDMQINNRHYHRCNFSFPLKEYYGVTIAFEIGKAQKILPYILDGFNVDINAISDKFCKNDFVFLMRASRRIEHIFSELYDLPEDIRLNYCKIKVLELLLFLGSSEVSAEREKRTCYAKSNVLKVKAAAEFIAQNPSEKITIEQLACKFNMSPTAFKSCFKGVFGETVHSYIKSFRMNLAENLLRNSDLSVIEIASEVGYENAGKFSAAFRSAFGTTPLAYRKSNVRLD